MVQAGKGKVELLAPAGSMESLKAAVAAGADAVYMGGLRFGARAYAENADEEGMKRAIDYAHLHGRRLYMTVNTLFKEEELDELPEFLLPYYKEGVDAVIVQDLGALAVCRECFPGLHLHASTQMTVTGAHGAGILKALGCDRVVLARELSLPEIRAVKEKTGMEIEAFVHGALCYCYSGQCLMSSLIGGRSGNRGRCAQPCRLSYEVTEPSGKGKKGGGRGKADRLLSLKDLCTLPLLPEIIEAGVYSLKIEGRMKNARYTAGVVSMYRKYLDRYLEKGKTGYRVEATDLEALAALFDRGGGFTGGYFKQENGPGMVARERREGVSGAAHPWFKEIEDRFLNGQLKEEVHLKAVLKEGSASLLTLCSRGVEVKVKGPVPGRALKSPLTREMLIKQLSKMGGTPFVLVSCISEVDEGLFMTIQELNGLRREGVAALEEAILERGRRQAPALKREAFLPEPPGQPADGQRLTASVQTKGQLETVLGCALISRVYIDSASFLPGEWEKAASACHRAGKECHLALPHILRKRGEAFLTDRNGALVGAGFDGLLVKTIEEIGWLCAEGIHLPFGTDASVYAWNHAAVHELKKLGASFLTLPWELNSRELRAPVCACAAKSLDTELIVYGRAPMMVTAQCIRKTTQGCAQRSGRVHLKDRTGAVYPVQNACHFCYNTILNPQTLSLVGEEALLGVYGPGSLRLHFTVETPEETKRVTDAYGAWLSGVEVSQPVKSYTRGHFRRGVE